MNALFARSDPPAFPPPYTTVVATLDSGYEVYAVWTGKVWRARGGEVSIKSWRRCVVKIADLELAAAA